uniref:Uncharacterized protein n=1 Tax=Myotis myotis TaxID=51298 RepID=A0A7J7Z5S8_MYOMY|nr:hypothetical protein mMyoMyo1_010791 [Myotis myotis]
MADKITRNLFSFHFLKIARPSYNEHVLYIFKNELEDKEVQCSLRNGQGLPAWALAATLPQPPALQLCRVSHLQMKASSSPSYLSDSPPSLSLGHTQALELSLRHYPHVVQFSGPNRWPADRWSS